MQLSEMAVELRKEQQRLESELKRVRALLKVLGTSGSAGQPRKRTMSAAVRAKIAAKMKQRWAARKKQKS